MISFPAGCAAPFILLVLIVVYLVVPLVALSIPIVVLVMAVMLFGLAIGFYREAKKSRGLTVVSKLGQSVMLTIVSIVLLYALFIICRYYYFTVVDAFTSEKHARAVSSIPTRPSAQVS
jgi:hypothetical protein